MRCDQVRSLLSARLDGESSPGEDAYVDSHLDACAQCRAWHDRAAAVTRLTRVAVAGARPEPDAGTADDLLAVVLAASPGRTWARAGQGLRVLLGLLGFGQFLVGIGQIASLRMSAGIGSAGGMTSDHLLHESAAWNVAIGAGYVWIASRRGRPAGALPILTAFVSVLVILSIGDLISGEVAAGSLLTHAFVLIGYAILLLLRHPGFDTVPSPGRRWRLAPDVADLDDAEPGRAGALAAGFHRPGTSGAGAGRGGDRRRGATGRNVA